MFVRFEFECEFGVRWTASREVCGGALALHRAKSVFAMVRWHCGFGEAPERITGLLLEPQMVIETVAPCIK